MSQVTEETRHVIRCLDTRAWYAWNDLMPPRPDFFHITGEVQVPNPGVIPQLLPRVPQGINPTILLLDLCLVQQPGNWIQKVEWAPVRYDAVIQQYRYRTAEIFCCESGETLASVPVEDIH